MIVNNEDIGLFVVVYSCKRFKDCFIHIRNHLYSFYREDETGEDVRYYSTLDQFDTLLSYLDDTGPERLLVYRLQKRYNDIARCMKITTDLFSSKF